MHKEATICNLRIIKEQWVDKLRYKKVTLEKYMEKGKGNWTTSTSCFRKTREPFPENLKKRAIGKGKCQKWISLLNSGEVYGKEERIHCTCHGWKKLKCN